MLRGKAKYKAVLPTYSDSEEDEEDLSRRFAYDSEPEQEQPKEKPGEHADEIQPLRDLDEKDAKGKKKRALPKNPIPKLTADV